MKLSGLTIVDARARPRPATIICDTSIREITETPDSAVPSLGSSPFIVPGLIDSHTHPLEAGLQLLFANLAGASSLAEVQERLRDRRADALEHGMMLGFNLEPDRLTERRYPERGELDEVIPDVPVFVYRADGHSAATNTAGLRLTLAGWPGVKPPGMDTDCDGRPTGVLRGEAYERASRVFKHRLKPETVREALRLAGRQAAAKGVTTIGALVGVEDTSDDEWRVILDGLATCEVRAVPYLQTWDTEVPRRFGLKQAGGCLLIDGSFGSRTAALREPYTDARSSAGAAYASDEKVLAFLRAASAAGLQATVHAIGDRAVEQVVRCHEQFRSNVEMETPDPANPLRHRIEHAELLNDSLIGRIAGLGLLLGVQPAFETEWGGPSGMYASRLGERWHETNPYRRLLDAGVRLAGGSDAPITPIDPITGIHAAMFRPNPKEVLSGDEALALFTTGAAYALSREGACGTIQVGKDADLTVLTSDPRESPSCQVVATFRGGACIYKDAGLAKNFRLED